MENELIGTSIIGTARGAQTAKTFRAFDPRTGEQVEPAFYSASLEELDRAVFLAGRASLELAALSGKQKAEFLRQIAANIEALGQALVERIMLETALLPARIEGERGRTCGQLRLFADLVEDGSWVDARIDRADLARQPLPKPDLRSMKRSLGAVAVFCASNFPLAYSVAGGDTASAFAAGCPVIVNAHPAHPGTAELVGGAIADAVRSCGLPEGTFSLLFSAGYEIGQALVRHEGVKAVGFTGSRSGGRALMDIAAARPEPIPVFAEMSSVNPVFILPGAITARSDAIAAGLHASFTTGGGQFCTKPGIVVLSANQDAFTAKLLELAGNSPPAPLLTPGIKTNYEKGIGERSKSVFAEINAGVSPGLAVNTSVFQTSAGAFLNDPALSDEIFGPTTLLVSSENRDELIDIARSLEGQLTASVFGTPDDLSDFADLIAILETKAGRLIFNGFPTGVEVCHSIVHGGPYPATSDPRFTSVGTRAIDRFSRLVCYQGFPEGLLPEELKDGNPLGIRRLVDGEFTRSGIAER